MANIELSKMLGQLRKELLDTRWEGQDSDLKFLIEDIEIELQIATTQEGEATVLMTQGLHSSGGCHGVLVLSMAFKMVNNLRMQAVKATLAGLPAARRRW